MGALLALLLAITTGVATAAPVDTTDQLKVPALATERASHSLLLDIIDTQERLIAVGERGHILYSTDGGNNWQQAPSPVYITLTAVHFPTPRQGWIVGHDGVVLHSGDGGSSWQQQLNGYQINTMVLDQARATVAGLRHQISNGEDSSSLQEQLHGALIAEQEAEEDNASGASKPLLDLYFTDRHTGYLVGAYGLLLKTLDGGNHWQLLATRPNNPLALHLNTVIANQQGGVIVAGESGIVLRSLDYGLSWQALDSPYQGSWYGLLQDREHPTRLWIYGFRGSLYRSDDFGNSWVPLGGSARGSLYGATHGSDGSLTVVGAFGILLTGRTEDRQLRQRRFGNVPITGVVQYRPGHYITSGVQGITHHDRERGALRE